MCQTRIKEVFPTWKSGAIFTALNSREVPWVNVFPALSLDLDYYGNFSGNKIISGLVENILPSDGALTSDEITILCDVIMGLYSLKWTKLWDTMNFDYNPIENYNMVEEMTDDETVKEYGKTNTRTDNLTHERTDNLSHGKTGTETETPNTTTQDDNDVFGFNSVDSVPSDSRTIHNTGNNQTTYNTQETDTGTETGRDTGTQSFADSGSDTQTRNYTLTRSGNIGVTTSQQMIEAERELWRMWNFFRGIVYPDIDRVLTIEIY